jgi:very-short-patch-repair endonuclease
MKKIELLINSDPQKFQENLLKVNSFDELCGIYETYSNGEIHKLFKNLIVKHNFSNSHWKKIAYNKKWELIERECPVCCIKFITKSGGKEERKHCSYKCANSFSRHTDESKNKIKTSIRQYLISRGKTPIEENGKVIYTEKSHSIICPVCNKEKITCRKNQKYCSIKCSKRALKNDPIYKQKLRDVQLKRVKDGIHNGWKSRKVVSYPEQFFMNVLNNNSIPFKHNEPFKGYFIDFALHDKMIALEIDGKQHKLPERIESDLKKDKCLTEGNWKVYRIEWNSINTEEGKKLMKEKIGKFFEIYNEKKI